MSELREVQLNRMKPSIYQTSGALRIFELVCADLFRFVSTRVPPRNRAYVKSEEF
ncbi:hypothetical protein D9619_011388 [Psilocybe cf. subviscida]|uniref:Uncharacterized protein n=1 Tax=Psilocybe cf. subviscida TaxID=2480587 RepID=A0A8H5BIU8_9AGAR|nr:hypothetical protein D9619_011388 [Psilocybe cf. subviscida]